MNTQPKSWKHEVELLENLSVTLTLDGIQALALVTLIQLASKHPDNTRLTRDLTEGIARQIQDRLALTPSLVKILQMGWDTDHDEPQYS